MLPNHHNFNHLHETGKAENNSDKRFQTGSRNTAISVHAYCQNG